MTTTEIKKRKAEISRKQQYHLKRYHTLRREKAFLNAKLFVKWAYKHRIAIIALTLLIATCLLLIPTGWWMLMNSIIRYEVGLPIAKYVFAFLIFAFDFAFIWGRLKAIEKKKHQ